MSRMEFETFHAVCTEVEALQGVPNLTRWFGLDVTLAEFAVLKQAKEGQVTRILDKASMKSNINKRYRQVLDDEGQPKVLGKGEFGEVSLWRRCDDDSKVITTPVLSSTKKKDESPSSSSKSPIPSRTPSSKSGSLFSRFFSRRSSSIGIKSDATTDTETSQKISPVTDEGRNNMVAVKKLSKYRLMSETRSAKQRLRFLQCVRSEVNVLKTMTRRKSALGGQYVSELMDVFEDENSISLVTPYYDGGDLFNHLVKGPLEESEAMRTTWQLVQAIYFIHEECKAMHCDIKPENVMFSDPTHRSIRVIDFGMSRIVNYGQSYSDACGSAYYTAPEVINTPSRKAAYAQPCDIWALGSLVFVLLYGFPCFAVNGSAYKTPSQIRRAIYRKILDGFVPRVFKASEVGYGPWFPDTIPASDLARDFIGRCMVSDPSLRTTARELLCHPWFASMRCEPPFSSIESTRFANAVSSTTIRWFPAPDTDLTRELATHQYILRTLLGFRHRRWDYRQLVGWIFMSDIVHSAPVLFEFLRYLSELMTTVPVVLRRTTAEAETSEVLENEQSQSVHLDDAATIAIAAGLRINRKQFTAVMKKMSAGMSRSVCKMIWNEMTKENIFESTAALIVGDMMKLMGGVTTDSCSNSSLNSTKSMSDASIEEEVQTPPTRSHSCINRDSTISSSASSSSSSSIEKTISFEDLALVFVIDYLTRNNAALEIAFHSLCQLSNHVRKSKLEWERMKEDHKIDMSDDSSLVSAAAMTGADTLTVHSSAADANDEEHESTRVSRMTRGLTAAVAVAAASIKSPKKKKLLSLKRRRSGSISLSSSAVSEMEFNDLSFDLNIIRDYIIDSEQHDYFNQEYYCDSVDGLISPLIKCLMNENNISNGELIDIMFDVIRGNRLTRFNNHSYNSKYGSDDRSDSTEEDRRHVQPHSPSDASTKSSSIQNQCCTSSFHHSHHHSHPTHLKMRTNINYINQVSYSEFFGWFNRQ